ncbi:hypothetical protein FB565_007633 [Actinoplanes lutulentus]|uniref:Uncharacterized protein n=1 Tax=Actinoplanes lutulentus TaxID=1287878 RepID=A0A327Z514_9ACTN|nr:hypothetical protein [Actinoplanes lutulentus]MBB2947862.1 hypothetical protein [Actinoplanes lutulentus]RAK29825.1 hypothetical protein B0I29_117151 [Actinoplanes lutulentus]
MTEQADRFTLTTGPDGRGLLTLALRRHPRASAEGYARAQRYWACGPSGAQPRWFALDGRLSDLQRPLDHADDARQAVEAHAAAQAYLPGVSCSGCGNRCWQPLNRVAVTRYVLTGATGVCLTCHDPSSTAEPAATKPTHAPPPPPPSWVSQPAPDSWAPPQVVDARVVGGEVTVRVNAATAAMLVNATGGDSHAMSTLVNELVSRHFGTRRAIGQFL